MFQVRLKPFSSVFSYPDSALGRIQPAFFAQQREFRHAHHPALSQTWLLALASRQNLQTNLIALLQAGCLLTEVGDLRRCGNGAWTCWIPGARLSSLSHCFCLNLPKQTLSYKAEVAPGSPGCHHAAWSACAP